MNATINKVYGATKSAKDGNIYLVASATMTTGESVLGQGVESNALVNLRLSSMSKEIAALLTEGETREDGSIKYTALDAESQQLGYKVTLRDVQPHAEKDGVFWATV